MTEQKTPITRNNNRNKKEFYSIFGSINEGAFVYDEQGRILLANSVANRLLGLKSRESSRGHLYSEYLHLYEEVGGQQFPLSTQADPLTQALQGTSTRPVAAHQVLLQQASGNMLHVDVYCAPIPADRTSTRKAICIIHEASVSANADTQKTQQIIQALLALMGLLPGGSDNEEYPQMATELLTSPDMQMITKSIIDLLRSQLASEHAWLLTIDATKDQVKFIVMSGFTPEQEALRHKAAENSPISAFINPKYLARLLMQEILIVSRKDIPIQESLRADIGAETLLCLPLFAFNQVIGCLVLAKSGDGIQYSAGEIELVKAMSMLITLILKQFYLRTQLLQVQAREQALSETYQRMNEFLDLASHELCTPSTILMGNLQLAQRRLQRGKMPATQEQWEHYQANMHQALENALHGARIQQRMIHDMLDDSRIQTNTLNLHLRLCNLQELVAETVAAQQIVTPERIFIIELPSAEHALDIMIDAPRIRRVINTFIRQAHAYSPLDRPIRICLCLEEDQVRVEVRDQGWGVPAAEQELIWKRFYRSTGVAVQNELDLSLGLGLYLCRAFIELHHGTVGVDSHPPQDTIFWFTLPLDAQE
ncbi:hypothetical protein KDA_71270 [Dictyobacter alpinus]|uniref:histidine kinase n=1 Tax=Dictyobacter alpinus TaxID=2014873 RepID=A0A402BJY0_9CHLR|nr:PAS domain-containing sensor histidine kinase [Dictyobacter alpinus]GCE31643.1 hypothetical protein KDA_71270 [Dictyobacter alpinus]